MGELCVTSSMGGAQDSGLGWNPSSSPPDPASLREEFLSVSAAEEAAQQVLNCIHPTLESEEKRRVIIDYLLRLIKSRLDCEVFPYGSVPLKTYLPGGDIDLTAINSTKADESLARDVLAILRKEENYKNAEFIVKDTQYIDAEVKLVKCLVQDTVVDISFNQLGGLSKLCLLKQADQLLGRNHLFKRSIILIKAWCFYESRILGANHGLISTYALETLVLYIFHLYNSSLSGPLAVLYKFLEYYSNFDWDNYCISLKGPVCKSSLPNVVVTVPESGWTNLMMFSEEFLENCMEMFPISSRELEGKPKVFRPKHINIIDPLKQNNNLGRSVHIGNFYRIRSAFKYGARKLGQVLSLPFDKVADEILKFFSNALARHGNENINFIEHLPVGVISEENMPLRSSVNGNDSVEIESKKEKDLFSETSYEGWYPKRHNDAVGTYDVITSSNNCCDPLWFFSKLSAENRSLETGNFPRHNLVDSASQKYGMESYSKDNNKHGELNYGYQWCMDYPYVDMTGDYDSHIRSLLYGQLFHGFSLGAVVHSDPSTPYWGNQFSQMMWRPIPIKQTNCWAADSAPPARGNGSHLPCMNNSVGERHPPAKSRKNVSGCCDHQFRRWDAKCTSIHSHGNGNQTKGNLGIEFGSLGNVAEEMMISCTAASTLVQER